MIAAAIVVSLVEGCPTPRVSSRALDVPVNRRELERWAPRLGMTADELKAELVERAGELDRVQMELTEPFRPWFQLTATQQRWNLFPVADPDPVWMHIEARLDGEPTWSLLYRPNDPAHAWRDEILEYRRIRATWNPGLIGPRSAYRDFARWIFAERLAEEPRTRELRVRMRQLHIHVDAPDDRPVVEVTGRFLWEERRWR